MLTEKTVEQILEVLDKTSKLYNSGFPINKAYQKAVKEVSLTYSIKYQTVADGCRRRLGLSNINEFIKILSEWLNGNPSNLIDLLHKNTANFEKYKIDQFFHRGTLQIPEIEVNRKVDISTETITIKLPVKTIAQLRSLAETERKSAQNLATKIIDDYVTIHYLKHIKNIISSLSQSHKDQILTELKNLR
ncbi:MAG: hypothetical protein AB7T17_08770 [Geobacter sp.]